MWAGSLQYIALHGLNKSVVEWLFGTVNSPGNKLVTSEPITVILITVPHRNPMSNKAHCSMKRGFVVQVRTKRKRERNTLCNDRKPVAFTDKSCESYGVRWWHVHVNVWPYGKRLRDESRARRVRKRCQNCVTFTKNITLTQTHRLNETLEF